MTQKEHDTFYGFSPEMSSAERIKRTKEIEWIAEMNGTLDYDPLFDEVDEWINSEYEDYKNEAVRELNSR